MKHPIYNGKTDSLITLGEGFRIPLFAKEVQYNDTSHASYRRRKRQRLIPLEFTVPLRVWNNYNRIPLIDVQERLNKWLWSDGPGTFKIPGTDYYFIGEFDGPLDIDAYMIAIDEIDVSFTSHLPYKIYDDEKVVEGKTITINSRTQIPTTPLIELSGLTGDDVQISISGDTFRRIRLSGTLPSNIIIDIEAERIYEKNSGLDRINLLRRDSAFEDFRIENGDVVTITNAGTNAKAKLTFKELLL